jgi:hypothetical protein
VWEEKVIKTGGNMIYQFHPKTKRWKWVENGSISKAVSYAGYLNAIARKNKEILADEEMIRARNAEVDKKNAEIAILKARIKKLTAQKEG